MLVSHAQLINAPVECIWRRTIDFSRLPDWLPTVSEVEVLDGEPLHSGNRVKIRQPRMGFAVWTILEVDPPNRFVWERAFLGMKMVARHHVSSAGQFSLNTLELELFGWPAPFLAPFLRKPILKSLTTENAAFKQICESDART